MVIATSNPIPSTQPYWDVAADTYERDFTETLVGQLLRQAVWRELDRVFRPNDRVLEINCGTGIDAVHLAEREVTILACDISQRMIDLARQRADTTTFGRRIDFRVLPTEDLGALFDDGPFDGAFSNFSGLNCVEDLDAVRRNLSRALRPGGSAVLCMLGRFVPWEIAWFLAHGGRSKALRRLRCHIECGSEAGAPSVHYYSTRETTHAFAPDFRLRRWKGVGIFVPPPYMDHWAQHFPRTTAALDRADRWLGRVPIFRNMANFVLLEFERT
jgi:ubiquinone/menaquinone biosynthesis C-methylase UbiE